MRLERAAVVTTEVYTLPWHYWFASAGTAVVFGYGVQEWKAGLDDAAPYERLEVGLPAEERAYDDAIAREFTGILITALAVIPAIALTVDFFAAADEPGGVVFDETRTVLGSRVCEMFSEPSQVVLRHGARSQRVETGSDGLLRLPGENLRGLIGISADPIILGSEEGEDSVLPMDTAWLAGWVIEHGDKGSQERYLTVFGREPGAARVRSALARQRRERDAEALAEAAAALKEARRSLGRREYDDAIGSLSSCFSAVPGHAGCGALVAKMVAQLQGRPWHDEALVRAVSLCMESVEAPLCAKVDARMARAEDAADQAREAGAGWHDTIVGRDADLGEPWHLFTQYLRIYAAWRTTKIAPWIRARIKAEWKGRAARFCLVKKNKIKRYGAPGWKRAAQYYCDETEGYFDLSIEDEGLGELEEGDWFAVDRAGCVKLLVNPICR